MQGDAGRQHNAHGTAKQPTVVGGKLLVIPLRRARGLMSRDPVCCPACADHFRGPHSDAAPMCLTACGHSLCKTCVEAVMLTPTPVCPVCCCVVDRTVPNIGLALLAEAHIADQCGGGEERDPLPAIGDQSLDTTSMDAACGEEVQGMAAQCTDDAVRLLSAADDLLAFKAAMRDSTRAQCESFSAAIDRVKAALDAHRTAVIADVEMLCHNREKAVDGQVDALLVSGSQLRAGAELGTAALRSHDGARLRHAHTSCTHMLAMARQADTVPSVSSVLDVVCDPAIVLSALPSLTRIRRCAVTASVCAITGPGATGFVTDAGTEQVQNMLCVRWPGDSGVMFSDLSFSLCDTDGDVCGSVFILSRTPVDSGVDITYRVVGYEGLHAHLCVTLYGDHVTGSPAVIRRDRGNLCQANGSLVGTLPLKTRGGNSGVVVSADGAVVIVVHSPSCTLHMYDWPSGERVRTVGKWGNGKAQFAFPWKVCLSPRPDAVLVTETDNKRVQELSVTGVHIRFLGWREIDAPVRGIAANSDIVVVTKGLNFTKGRVVVLSYASGSVVRQFGEYGSLPGKMGHCDGVRITPDDQHIVAVDSGNRRLCVFTVGGQFERCMPVGEEAGGATDVDFSGSNAIVVSDGDLHRMRVLSLAWGTVLHEWGCGGGGPSQFRSPAALAVHRNMLFVLDANSPRVQVFT